MLQVEVEGFNLKRLLAIIIIAICLLNIVKVEAYSRGVNSDEIRSSVSLRLSPLSNASKNAFLDSSQGAPLSDDDCTESQCCHNCHLGHCSFVLAYAPPFPILSFKTIHFSPYDSLYAKGINSQLPRPPQV